MVNHDVAIMAVRGDLMVGTMGIIQGTHWWGNVKFLANRWCFANPGSRAWKPMLREAKAIAVASDMEFHLIAEERGKITILNRSPLRDGKRIPLGLQPGLKNSPNTSAAILQ